MRSVLICVLTVVACSADDPPQAEASNDTLLAANDGAAGDPGVATDETTELEPIGVDRPDASGAPHSQLIVIDRLVFPGVAADQKTVIGFDLDQKTSDENDAATCGIVDLVSPSGQPGIDNQLGIIIPALDLFGLGAFQTLVQRAIEEGGLLIFFQLDSAAQHLAGEPLEGDVTITLRVGQGAPLLGTDGRLLSGQTFHVKPDSETLEIPAHVTDGRLRAEGFNTVVPIVVFGVPYEITLNDAVLEGRLTTEGGLEEGLLGGSIPLADIIHIAEVATSNDFDVLGAVQGLVAGLADQGMDDAGECQALSAAIQLTGVSAFLHEDYFRAAASTPR